MSILYILCPENRKDEAASKIAELENSGIITWEEVLKYCQRANNVSNSVAKIVQLEFIKYLERRFSFVYNFESKAVHLRKYFPEYGTVWQSELVGVLWSYFPNSSGRLGTGKTHSGYHFYTDLGLDLRGWFGFVKSSELKDKTGNDAELIIASTYKPLGLSDDIKEVELTNDKFIGAPGKTFAWVINFDSNWNSAEIWRKKLAPFWIAMKDGTT